MTKTIRVHPAPGSEALPVIFPGRFHELGPITPFAMTIDVTPEDFAATMAPLGTRHENPCLQVRWLSAGTPFGVIQFCELEHHMNVHAHRMTNPDGSLTTWRS